VVVMSPLSAKQTPPSVQYLRLKPGAGTEVEAGALRSDRIVGGHYSAIYTPQGGQGQATAVAAATATAETEDIYSPLSPAVSVASLLTPQRSQSSSSPVTYRDSDVNQSYPGRQKSLAVNTPLGISSRMFSRAKAKIRGASSAQLLPLPKELTPLKHQQGGTSAAIPRASFALPSPTGPDGPRTVPQPRRRYHQHEQQHLTSMPRTPSSPFIRHDLASLPQPQHPERLPQPRTHTKPTPLHHSVTGAGAHDLCACAPTSVTTTFEVHSPFGECGRSILQVG
jgi:hypothetical protein